MGNMHIENTIYRVFNLSRVHDGRLGQERKRNQTIQRGIN